MWPLLTHCTAGAERASRVANWHRKDAVPALRLARVAAALFRRLWCANKSPALVPAALPAATRATPACATALSPAVWLPCCIQRCQERCLPRCARRYYTCRRVRLHHAVLTPKIL